MSWADRIKALRDRFGLTIDGLAELMGLDYRTIYGWERLAKEPDTSCPGMLVGLLETHPEEGFRLLSERPRPIFGEETWAERVRRVRKTLGLSLARFAQLTGVTHGTVVNWERGLYQAEDCVKVLLDFLEYNPDEAAAFLWPGLAWRSIEEAGPEWSPERIWLLFESLGMNREDLAALLRMEPQAVQGWFTGRRGPGPCPFLLLWLLETHGPKAYFMMREAKVDEEWPPERVRAVRGSMGLTLREMGELLRMTLGSYHMFERKGLPSGCWRLLFSILENRREEMIELLRALPTV